MNVEEILNHIDTCKEVDEDNLKCLASAYRSAKLKLYAYEKMYEALRAFAHAEDRTMTKREHNLLKSVMCDIERIKSLP